MTPEAILIDYLGDHNRYFHVHEQPRIIQRGELYARASRGFVSVLVILIDPPEVSIQQQHHPYYSHHNKEWAWNLADPKSHKEVQERLDILFGD